MLQELAVAEIERLVVDEQPDDLAVGDVHEGLAGLGVAVSRLGVRQRPQLVERVEVRARELEGLALVEVGAQADVPVREGEDRLGPGEHRRGRAASRERDQGSTAKVGRRSPSSSSSPRSETTSRRLARGARRCGRSGRRRRQSRSRRRARRRRLRAHPRRPRPLPAGRPSARAAARNVSGAGLPRSCSAAARAASIRTSNSPSRPAACEGVAAVRAGGDDRKAQARVPHRPHVQRRSLECLEPAFADQRRAGARSCGRRARSTVASSASIPRARRNPRTPSWRGRPST